MQTFGEPYDYGSIMHYGPYSFAIDKSKPTIIPKHSDGHIMGQRLALSREDVDKIQKLYNCGSGNSWSRYLLRTAENETFVVKISYDNNTRRSG